MMPTVMIAESAPWPLVNDLASSVASSMVSTPCVAPTCCAFSRFIATGSTAMTLAAPACEAPWTALIPIPPMPMTITVCPGCTWAELTAEPQPVPTLQPSRQTLSSGQVVVDLHRRVGRDRGGLHEGRDAAHLADRGVRPGELEPEVGRVLPPGAREQPGAEVAEVLLARSAPAAVAAGGQEREDDVVALLDPLVVRRCRRDDARALVAARERVDADRDVAGGDVVVGVAKARWPPA